MGQQRRIAQDLMRQFVLTEEEAYSKANDLEALNSIGDQIISCMFHITTEGDIAETLADLHAIRNKLHIYTINLSAAFTGVKKRPKPLTDEEFSKEYED